jgi:hypothetical protein
MTTAGTGAAGAGGDGAGGAGAAGGAGGGGPSCRGAVAEGMTQGLASTWSHVVTSAGDDSVGDIVFDPPRVLLAGARAGMIHIGRVSVDGPSAADWERTLSMGAARLTALGDAVLVTGTFTESLAFPGCMPLAPDVPGTAAIFVARLDANGGNCVWARAITSTVALSARAIAADSGAAMYLTGELGGTIVPPPGACNETSFNGEDLFLAKFTNDGQCAWVRAAGSSGIAGQRTTTVAVRADPGGFVVAGGAYAAPIQGQVAFPGGDPLLAGNGDLNAFLAAFSLQGDHRWSRGFGGATEEQISGIALDSEGNVLAAGHYQEAFDANADGGGPPCNLPEPDEQGVLIMKLGSNGQVLWARGFGDQAFADGITMDVDDSVFITGSFRSVINFGGGDLTGPGDVRRVFVAKLDKEGHHLWSAALPSMGPGEGDDYANAASAREGTLLVAGSYQGTVDFGGTVGQSMSVGADGFVIGLDGASGQAMRTSGRPQR